MRTISSSTADGAVVELAQERALLVGEGELGGVADGGLVGRGADLADQRAELFEDVVDRLDQPGAVADQAVAARLARLSTGPGTAKTSRFCSIAWLAVESEPLRGVASTTTTPRQRPEMIRLRCGKRPGERPLAHRHLAERRRPAAATSRASSSCSGG